MSERFDREFSNAGGDYDGPTLPIKAFIERECEAAREEGRREWENINKQYLSRVEAYEKGADEMQRRVIERVGMLRQWLNEDRVTDKKMVTNKELLVWLLPLLKDKENNV